MVSEMLTINTMKTCNYSRTASHLPWRAQCLQIHRQLKCPISSVCVRKGQWIKHSNTIMTMWQSFGKLENCCLFPSSDDDKKFDKQACYEVVIFAQSGVCVCVGMWGGGDDGMFILAPNWHPCPGYCSGVCLVDTQFEVSAGSGAPVLVCDLPPIVDILHCIITSVDTWYQQHQHLQNLNNQR